MPTPRRDRPRNSPLAVERPRCSWAQKTELERDYHDTEWGVPLRDDRRLFELLCLEGMQAGLSWHTILSKRDGYRRLFHDFDIPKVAAMTDATLKRLLDDASIVRHWGKITAIRDNARVVHTCLAARGALTELLWSFVDGTPRDNRRVAGRLLPASTAESAAMSKAARKLGFRFVGPTTCYAFMQAAGMVNDHVTACYRYKELA